MTPTQPEASPQPQDIVTYDHLPVGSIPPEVLQDENIREPLKAYDTVYGRYLAKDYSSLSPEEQSQRIAERDWLQDKVRKVLRTGVKNRLYHSVRYPDVNNPSKMHSSSEYLPLNELNTFIGEEVVNLREMLKSNPAPEVEQEILRQIEEYDQLKSKLIARQRPFNQSLHRKPRSSARVQQEYKDMRKYHLLTVDYDKDIKMASNRVSNRLQLYINPKRSSTPPPIAQPLQPIPSAGGTVTGGPTTTAAPPPTGPTPPPYPAPPITPPSAVLAAPVSGVVSAVTPPATTIEAVPVEAAEEPVEPPITPEDLRYDMAVVDRTVDVFKRAREMAETQLREEMKKGGWYNPMDWARKSKLRIFEEYYRQLYTARAYRAIIENNNSYLQMNVVKNAITDAQKTHKYKEQIESSVAKAEAAKELLQLQREGVMTLEGQRVEVANVEARDLFIDHLLKPISNNILRFSESDLNNLRNATDANRITLEKQLQQQLRMWMHSIHDPQVLNNPQFQADNPELYSLLSNPSVQDQLKRLFGRDATRYGVIADFFASDVIDIAHKIESDRRDHHFALDQLDAMLARTNVTLANMSWAAESQAQFNAVDKFIAWSQRRKLTGAILNPVTVGAAVSIGSFFALRAPSIAGKFAHIWAPGIGGIAGGTLAAFRRSYDLKVDRAAHQVDRTYGAQAVTRADVDAQLSGASWMQKRLAEAGGAYRRADLEALAYDTKRAEDLINGIITTRSLDLSQANNQEILLRQLAEVRARMNFSAAQKVDLIEYSGRENVEQSRLLLVKAIAEGRVALHDAGLTDDQVRDRLNTLTQEQTLSYAVNKSEKDRVFLGYRISEAAKAGVAGGVLGIAAGLGAEEVMTMGRRLYNAAAYTIADSSGKGVGETNLEHIIRRVGELAKGGKEEHVWQPSKLDLEQLYDTPGGGNITLSKDLHMYVDNNHNVTFIDRSTGNPISIPAGHIDEQGDMVFEGKLPESLQEELRSLHFIVDEQTTEVAGSAVPDAGKDEFVPTHEDMATGHKTLIPEGSMWVKDGENWDLVMAGDNTHTLLNDVRFNPDGTIAEWDNSSELAASVYTGKFIEEKTGAMMEIVTPTGEWKEHGVNLDRYEWYSYDKAGSQGNELKLYTYKSGDTIRLSMHNMGTSWQTGLDPREIHVPDVYKGLPNPGGEAGFAFSLPGHLKEPIIALANSEGLLDLNPHDIDSTHMMNYIDTDGSVKQMQLGLFSKMVLNYDAYSGLEDGNIATELNGRFNVWKVGRNDEFGFISAGRYVEQDGQQVWQSFATIRGKGEVGAITTETIKRVFEPAKINLARPIEPVYETVTDVTAPRESLPIALPFAPRYPLDVVETARLVYYYAGMPSQSERLQYEERRSPRLRTNPRAILDPVEEIRWYFEQQTQEFRNELEQMNNRIGEQMHDECRVAICMPVASHQEGANIYNTLLNYTDQRDEAGNVINTNSFEIVLFLNRPQNNIPDATKSEVERFKREHPEVKVRVLEKIFPVRPKFGVLTKYINDMALLRSIGRTSPINNDLILVTNDADADLISKGYINAIISEYDKPENQHIDAALGRLEWNPESYIRYPGFHLANRFIQFVEAGMRHDRDGKNKHIGSSGANFTLKSSIYAGVGGYLSDVDAGVDTHLGRMIKAARKPLNGEFTSDSFPIDYMGRAWLVTSPRRGISYYTRGEPIVRQWNDFGTRHGVRENDWRSTAVTTETIDTMDPMHIQNDINAVIGDYGLNTDSRLVRRTLNFLGLRTIEECQERVDKLHSQGKDAASPDIQALLLELGISVGNYHADGNKIVIDKAGYKVQDGRIIITDLTKVKELLQKYKDEEMEKVNQRKNQNIIT